MSGKGCKPRPVNKERFDRNHILAFGKDCKNCVGTGRVHSGDCPYCDGLGRVDKYTRQEGL